MKLNYFLIISLLFFMACESSSDAQEPSGNAILTCSPDNVEADALGGVYTLNVTCSNGEWNAYVDDGCKAWTSVKVSGSLENKGTVTVTVDENKGKETRKGLIIVKSGTGNLAIPVTQMAPLQVSMSEVFSNSTGETIVLTVTSASDWSVKAVDSWIAAEKKNGTTLNLSTKPNEATQSRTGSVEVLSASQKVVITVVQESAEDHDIVVPEGYSLVWHDEFNEGTTLSNDWTHEVQKSGWVNHELQNYVAGSVDGRRVTELVDGKLNIHCFKGSDGKIYSGRVYAKVNSGWKYGYFEARILLPKGKGTWPAFWMMPVGNDWNTNPWPMCGEIDIMEEVGVVPNEVSSSIHTQDYNHTKGTQKTHAMTIDRAEGEYHVYALKWTEDAITTYVDGKVQLSVTKQQLGSGHNQWPFHYAFYPILNLAWGGDWGGMNGVDELALPVTMKVDYLRVFQKKE